MRKGKHGAATERLAPAASAKALLAALDRLPVAFALFDAQRQLAAWNTPLSSLGLFPQTLLRKGVPLAQFQRRDAGLKRRTAGPHDVRLPDGKVLEVARKRVPPGHLLLTYEDVSDARSARDEAAEALEQRAATAEILQVISRSPNDLRPVFDAILEKATRLCDAHLGTAGLYDGERYRQMAQRGATPALAKWLFRPPFLPDPRTSIGGMVRERTPIHHADIRESPGYRKRVEGTFKLARLSGARSYLAVPMLKDGRVAGGIIIYRREVRPFTQKQIELVSTFASQAVIAIENVRQFNETKEALERQTATADILKVIASSPADVQPVFEAIADSAMRLLKAWSTAVNSFDGEMLHLRAARGARPDSVEHLRQRYPMRPGPGTLNARCVQERAACHVADTERDPDPAFRLLARERGYRAALAVPLLKDGQPIGAIGVSRAAPGAFADVEVELLQTFADQAVIAIENVRLFNETKEALERQTATAEILKVIASSPSDVQPVLNAVAASAARLCEATDALIHIKEGANLRYGAHYGEIATSMQVGGAKAITRDWAAGRGALEGRLLHIHDVQAEAHEFPDGAEMARTAGFRTVLVVPLMRDVLAIGTITIRRTEVRPFTDNQVELLKSFADQAVIAIENVRLFNETKEALERQTATSEILRVIASSPSDVQPVFDVIGERAEKLCDANISVVSRVDGELIHLVSIHGVNEAGVEAMRRAYPMRGNNETVTARAVRRGTVIHVKDVLDDPDYEQKDTARTSDFRSGLGVPMLREGQVIGAIFVARTEPGLFTPIQVDLLKTFADQAVIAIENVRLFNETKEALERQTATAEILKVISGSPTDVQPVFDAIVTSAARLFGRRATLRIVEPGGTRRRARSEAATADSADLLPIDDESLAGRVILHATAMQVVDTLGPDAPPYAQANAHKWDFRANAAAPLIRDGKAIGSISVASPVPGAMSDKQMALLATFADQAVIAIENVRLFNETKEALDRQTATAEILKVIASSPSDVQPVLDIVAESAARLCDTAEAVINLRQGDLLSYAAHRGQIAIRPVGSSVLLSREMVSGRAVLESRQIHILDIQAETDEFPVSSANARENGTRTILATPMLREGIAIGAIVIRRTEARLFSEQQLMLVKTFADQAVIAIENVRLFNETKEALERQTATADILRVIGSSPTDTQPVFEAIVQSGLKLFPESTVGVTRPDGDQVHMVAIANRDAAVAEATKARFPIRLTREYLHSTAILDARVVDLPDAEAAKNGPFAPGVANFLATGNRAMTVMPMVRGDRAIGAISVTRPVPGPLTEKQLSLLRIFADQAVIAIENVRLFNETKEALERQTATAEILQVIGSSPTDTQPVFDAIVNSGVRLFPGAMITVARPEGGSVRAAAIAHEDITMVAGWRERFTTPLSRDRLHAAAILDAKLIDFPDAEAEKDGPLGPGVRNFLLSGNRAVTIMPMLRGEGAIGAISVTRAVPGPLSDKQIAILRTFADQAVIAIENVRLFNETKEALERQTATAEILKVIASSPSDVQPVFDAIVNSVARLFGRKAALRTVEAEGLRRRARSYDPTPGEFHGPDVEPLDRNSIVGLAILEGRTVQWADTLVDGAAHYGMEKAKSLAFRSIASAPLMREEKAIGVISVSSPEPGALSDKQMELLSTFADQAVIAIQNVRLFNETRESLERQTATAEILKVIASSPSDVQPVFDAIAASARRLLGGDAALVARRAGDTLELAAFTSTGEAADTALRQLFPAKITGKGHMGKAILSAAPVLIDDIEIDLNYSEEFRASARTRSLRSIVSVPMLREGEAIGGISVNRATPGRFSDHQTNLLRTFADQAVIAIENVRLFNETQEALARQEAAAQVLRSISESVSDTAPVFTAILDCSNRLIPSIDYVQVQLIEGSDRVMLVDHRFGQVRGAAPGKQDERRAELMAREAAYFPRPLAGSTLERALNQGRVVILADTLDGPDTPPATLVEARRWGHSYSQITVPLMREGRCIGAIEAFRRQLGGFEAKESSLLESFADQAVIAIENVRLFNELQSRTEALGKSVEKLTALGEVGQAISSTLDLEKVLKTIATHALRLTGLDGASIYEYDEASEEFRVQVADNFPEEFLQTIRSAPIRKGDGTVGRVAITLEPIQVPDILDESYRSSRRELLVAAGYRAILTVPLLREGRIIGALNVTRKMPGPFAEEIVELLKTFATQSAMAIQNARLFREIAEKGKQLEEASKHKSQFLASMSHELRTPLNAILGFNEMILGDIYGEVPADMKEPLTDIQTSGKHLLRLINNVLDLAKIEAGRMELALDDYSVHDTVESVRSTLRPLAEAKGLELAVDVPSDIPLAHGDGGRITQCLMNLAGNSLKFTKQGSVGISVALENGALTYRVKDTGIGIPADKIGGLFTEFKQTDATIASEYGGTGLGLSITKKFIEMHGGRIWAESEPGSGSTFIFEIPLRAKEAKEA